MLIREVIKNNYYLGKGMDLRRQIGVKMKLFLTILINFSVFYNFKLCSMVWFPKKLTELVFVIYKSN